jgi:hypothetical protein
MDVITYSPLIFELKELKSIILYATYFFLLLYYFYFYFYCLLFCRIKNALDFSMLI